MKKHKLVNEYRMNGISFSMDNIIDQVSREVYMKVHNKIRFILAKRLVVIGKSVLFIK
jgi:hypothetical protein